MRQARACTMAMLEMPHHDPDHEGGERADKQSAAEQRAGERGGADARPPHLLDHHQQRRAGQRVADLVLRLIQQDSLQTIDRQRPEHPATHGVDVEIADQRQWPVLPPQVEQGIQSLGTGEQHGHHTADQCGGGATCELLAERVEEPEEHHAAHDGVGQQEVVQPYFPLQCPVFQRRQQVREPVVMQPHVDVKRIGRKATVALAHFRHDRHRPHEVRREVRTVGAPFGQVLAHLRIRARHDERDEQNQQRQGQQVAPAVPGDVEAATERGRQPGQDARGQWHGDQQEPGPDTQQPEREQTHAAERESEWAAQQEGHRPPRPVLAEGAGHRDDAGSHPEEADRDEPCDTPGGHTQPGRGGHGKKRGRRGNHRRVGSRPGAQQCHE